MKPRAFILLLFWPALLLLTAAVQEDQARVGPESPTYEVGPDTTIAVPIYLENAADVYAIDVRASYDPFLIEVIDADPNQVGVQIQPGQFPQPDFVARKDVDTQAGTIHYVMTQINPTPPANGRGVLFVIQLRSKGTAAETSLRIDQVEIADRSGMLLPVQWAGVDLVVGGESRSDPVILATGIAVQTPGGAQEVPATATSGSSAPTATQQSPSATPTKVMAETNPTALPDIAVGPAPGQASAATRLSTAPDPETVASAGSEQEAEQPPPDNSEDELIPATTSADNADLEPQSQVSAEFDSLAQAVPADAQNAQAEFSQVNEPDLAEKSESLTVIGENVTIPSSAEPLPAESDAGSSSPLVLAFIAVVTLLFVGAALLLFLRRSS